MPAAGLPPPPPPPPPPSAEADGGEVGLLLRGLLSDLPMWKEPRALLMKDSIPPGPPLPLRGVLPWA